MVLPAKLLFSAVIELIMHTVLKNKMSCWSHLCSREWYWRTPGDAGRAVISYPKSTGTWDGRSRAWEQMFWGSGYHTVLSSVLGIAWHPWHSWEVLVQILKICVRERMTKSTTAERLVRAGLELWMEAHERVPPAALHVSVQAGALWQHSPICCSVPVAGRPAGVVYECCSTVWIGKSNTDLGRMRLERWAAAVPAHSKEQRCL